MNHSIPRRPWLAGAALMLPLSAPRAQGGGVDELQGRLTAASAARFGRFVADAAGKPVSIRVTAAPAEGRDFAVSLDGPRLLVNLSRPERMEIVAHGDYALRDGDFVVDGVFAVKAEGMQQGILIFGLEPLPGQRARQLRDAGVRRVALS